MRLKESIVPIVNFGQFTLMIFCSFFFPFSVLGPLVVVSYIFPMSFSIDILRATIFQSTPELASILISQGIDKVAIYLEWMYMVLSALLLPVIGYKYYMYSINKGRLSGNLSDY